MARELAVVYRLAWLLLCIQLPVHAGRSVASCYAVKLRRASDSGGVRILNSRLWAGLASRRCRSNSRPSVRSNTVKQASAAASPTYRIAAAFAVGRAAGAGARRGRVSGWVPALRHTRLPPWTHGPAAADPDSDSRSTAACVDFCPDHGASQPCL